ncbi:MAG: hypothetical protein CSA70_08785 [Rhodobacterales bacterium]|nr:MAG: hypothetical protein CSA70_08785 [Rhodobacterales bacterium]
MNDEDKVEGRLHGEQFEPEQGDGLMIRIVYLVLLWLMFSVSQTILWVIMLVQLAIMALNKGESNENLAEFGTDLGVWMAKAVRYMTGASDVKPWPWSDID